MIRVGVGTTVVGGIAAGFFSIGAATGGGLWLLARFGETAYERIVHGSPRAVVAHVPVEGGARIALRRGDLGKVHVGTDRNGAFWMRVPNPQAVGFRMDTDHAELLSGESALRAAGMILPAMNWGGATKSEVERATGLVEASSSVNDLFHSVAQQAAEKPRLDKLDTPLRLALEMATHEESERRALEGELALLEAAWKEAEEIAAIADNLLLPPDIDERVRKARGA